MFWLNVKFIIRNLLKKKLFTSINIIGIVIGLTVSSLLLMYVKKELEMNKFFPNFDRIYRVENNGSRNFSKKKVDVLRNHIPEIEQITKYHGSWSQQDIVKYSDRDYEIKNAFYADSVFFSVFQFKAVYGEIKTALANPRSMVLTRSLSEKIFGPDSPVGKIVTLKTSSYGINEYTVTGVIQDVPNACSFKFDAVFSLSSLNLIDWYRDDGNNWGTNRYTSFALLGKNTDLKELSKKIELAFKENSPGWVSKNMAVSFNPLKGLHFRSKYGDGVFQSMKKPIVNLLGAIGILILLIACFNYFNLSNSQIEENLIPIGIKKINGAKGKNLVFQSVLETIILLVIALGVTFSAIIYILPSFNDLTESSFTLKEIFSSGNLSFLGIFFSISLLFFALFPALVIQKQKVVTNLKGGKNKNSFNHLFKNGLIVFQFLISTVLIICTIMLNKQYQYMLDADYGFDKENIAYIPLSPQSGKEVKTLEQEFERNAYTKEVTLGSHNFGQIANSWGRDLIYNGERTNVQFDVMFVSHDFFKLFDLKIIQGRGFDENSAKRQDIVFNESFINKYQLAEPLKTKINQGKDRGNVIGVAKDFNYNSMREQINPMGFVCSDDWVSVLFVKFNGGNISDIKEAFNNFRSIWHKISPDYPFEYHFLDEHFENIYRFETHMMRILTIASILALIIAGLGLFGLAFYATNRRIKEIGIRRVNGAMIREIVALLNKGFLIRVFLAFVLACPISYVIIEKWLQTYAYKSSISWWIFFAGGSFVILLALITVSLQSFRVASRNPVESLRYE